ncbi:MAG: FecR domain-containing protein [Gammaproteobacteria bacterium]|nr:FecR domain-containing protein [Gammaproteobacteria bacterium]
MTIRYMNPFSKLRCLLIFILLLTSAYSVNADDDGWNYTVMPGDTLTHISEKYLDRLNLWQQLQKINNIDDTTRLKPGTVLYIPYALSGGSTFAEVVWVRGDAKLIGDNTTTMLSRNMKLRMGQIILTGKDGSLTLRLMDQSRVLISPNSRIKLSQMIINRKSGQIKSELTIEAGAAESVITPTESVDAHYEIKTPALSLAVRGTRFRVLVDSQTGMTRTMVLEGKVEASAQGQMVAVAAGQGTLATPGSSPAPARDLLEPPILINNPPVLEYLPIQFSWQPLEGAKHYRVELLDSNGSQQIDELTVIDTQVQWKNLPDNEYQLRVSGIDDIGLEGKPAKYMFSLNATPEPPMLLKPLNNNVMPTNKVIFRWAKTQGLKHYHLQISDAPDFKHIIVQIKQLPANTSGINLKLPVGQYYWRIAAAMHPQGFGPFSISQNFKVVEYDVNPNSNDNTNSFTIAWKPGILGQKYKIQVAKDSTFSLPIFDATQDTPQANIELPNRGTYYIRMQRIDNNGLYGLFETPQQFIFSPTP